MILTDWIRLNVVLSAMSALQRINEQLAKQDADRKVQEYITLTQQRRYTDAVHHSINSNTPASP